MKNVYVVMGLVAGGQWCEFADFDSKIKAERFIKSQLTRTKTTVTARNNPGKYYRFYIREDYIHDYDN